MRVRLYRYLHSATAPTRSKLTWLDTIEVALVVVGFLAYFLVRGCVVDRTGEALENARWIINLQKSMGIFVEPAINEWALASDLRVQFFNFVYFWLDFPLIVAVGLFFFWKSRFHYTLLRDSLLISGAIALVSYLVFPVAPPRYLPEWGFVDTLEAFSNLSYQAQSMQPFVNPFAAVPSLHVGWALLLAIVVFMATQNWIARVLVVAVLAVQTVAVMATANHYLFDALVGLMVSLGALMAALWLQSAGYPAFRAWVGGRASRLEAQRLRCARTRV
ncbi:MAG: phosphatase PAP2 family protein [Chloroflexi bacterium]|nr:phosphatase PAP2 family protein [Chloroflexota bacterium]